MASVNSLTKEECVRVIAALVEGNSIRATVRMTGIAKNTVAKLLRDVGKACERYHDKVMVNLPCKRLQVDEIWSFCQAKQKNVPETHQGEFGYGDVWTWVAIDADTKLVPQWLIGLRDAEWANAFISDLAYRLKNRVQLTSDGLKVYLNAVEEAFGGEVDHARLVKLYGSENADPTEPVTAHKYSPGHVTGCQLAVISRQSRSASHIHVIRGTAEPHDENVHATVYPTHKWLQRESRESWLCCGLALHALQLLSDSSDAESHARYGCWRERPRLGIERACGPN